MDNVEGGNRPYHHGDLRHALLQAAEEELKEKGIEGFTLRGCAKRAGVSHAAPAHHFRDADALLTALAAVAYARLTAAMAARSAKAKEDAADQLVAIGLGYIDFATAEPALFKLMFSSDKPDFSDPVLGEAATAAYKALVEAVCAAKGSDDEDAAAPDIAAAWAMVHGIAELVNSGQLRMFSAMGPGKRQEVYRTLLRRVLPHPGRGVSQPLQ
ncbi:MAG TPA: TetR/AcrR family transcriptional regulator [Rhizobiaceae bacterium]|nr:TetR/AcrR family transcriptional regulator [Rhizobiaceae bacterium]